MAGMTLRLARSPEAPNKTTVQGSATPPYTEPVRPVSPDILSPREMRAIQQSSEVPLYLNPIFCKLGTQLLRVLMVDCVHAQPAWTLQVQRAVVNEEAFLWWALGNFQSNAKNRFLGLP